jgi:molybdate transport system substrate-binding protein
MRRPRRLPRIPGCASLRAFLGALAVWAGVLSFSAVAQSADAAQLTVFAAASMGDVMRDLAPLWKAQGGDAFRTSLAGSSVLARQIQQGAPADVFISANAAWMDLLERDGVILPGTRSDLAANTLVLIARDPQAAAQIDKRLGNGRLAMALVDAVPAGIYGKAALETLGAWPGLAPRIAQADNVRAALALVASGEAPLGIVYATDALAEPRVRVIATFPPGTHPPIRYPVAAVAGGHDAAARAFLAFLRSPGAAGVLRAHGFLPAPER